VTRRVPRTETCQVPVRVYCPIPKGKGKGCDGDDSFQGDVPEPSQPTPTPAEPEEETEASQEPNPVDVASFPVAASVNLTAGTALASDHFVTGLSGYWNGDYSLAAEQFQVALEAAPGNAKYAYFVALALHQAERENQAVQALVHAVELERQSPIRNWGRVMERVQGASRVWLEETRRELGETL
jgi:hypothetical protein